MTALLDSPRRTRIAPPGDHGSESVGASLEAAASRPYDGRAPTRREALLQARESAVAERSGELFARARLLARLEARVAAREEAVDRREARVESVSARLSADAAALDRRRGRRAPQRTVALEDAGAQPIARGEDDPVLDRTGRELGDSAWWSRVTGGEPGSV